ncbi:hypothetical protein F3Y22_tig00110160pilonHSYRG00625 [Hibiscus syriacus]|uniref:CCHC-type domain-containing protein n=1 Tax=Hibiscus syriacus TaxID=106335 RepID=A0A6A3BFC1_HIBSY|nr:hypothetical protein F3Y22_tig00110160pilonHSYRG00625 [Hibiscus syriacus]
MTHKYTGKGKSRRGGYDYVGWGAGAASPWIIANKGEGSVGVTRDPEGFVTYKAGIDGGGRLGRIAAASGKNHTIMLGGRGHQRLYGLKMQDDHDLAQHVNVFNQIISDLARLDVKIEDEDKAMIILCLLPLSYEHMRKQNAGESSQADSLYVKGNRDRGRKPEKARSGKRNFRSKSRDKKTIHCYKCKEAGHMKRECLKLKKQTDEKRDDSSKSVNMVEDDNSDCSEGDMLSISTTQLTDAWILDFGCSYHITPNREWFSTYRSVYSGSVYLGDDRCCNIVGIGDVKIKMYDGSVRTSYGVRHIPDLKKNLISLGTLHKNGFIPKADEDRETIRIVKGALTVMKGKMTAGNIYRLLGSTVVGGVHSVESCDDTIKLWHMRLAHLSERERMNRSLNERARCLRLNTRLPKHLWAKAINMVCYLINRLPRASLAGKVAEESMLQQKRDMTVVDFKQFPVEKIETSQPTSGGSATLLVRKTTSGWLPWLRRWSLPEGTLQSEQYLHCLKVFSTPLANHFKLSSEQYPKTDKEAEDMANVSYSNVVGCLMYAMKSTVQFVVALSTTEVEYMAAAEAAKEALWLTGLVNELGVQQGGVQLLCDNQYTIHMAKNHVYRARTKHIDVKFHKIRELVAFGEILFQNVHANENVADMFTKPITTYKFIHCLDSLNVLSC